MRRQKKPIFLIYVGGVRSKRTRLSHVMGFQLGMEIQDRRSLACPCSKKKKKVEGTEEKSYRGGK